MKFMLNLNCDKNIISAPLYVQWIPHSNDDLIPEPMGTFLGDNDLGL